MNKLVRACNEKYIVILFLGMISLAYNLNGQDFHGLQSDADMREAYPGFQENELKETSVGMDEAPFPAYIPTFSKEISSDCIFTSLSNIG